MKKKSNGNFYKKEHLNFWSEFRVFDPNNDMNYSPGGYSPGGSMYGPQDYDMGGKPQIDFKKYLPMIIGLGVLLIVAFFLLNWLGSQREIFIGITDLDGKRVSGKLTLLDSSGNPIETELISGKYKVNLFPGDYYASVTADGYKLKEGEVITIDGETKQGYTQNIKLVKDISATLQPIIETSKIYEGQVIEGKIYVQNTGGNSFEVADIIPTTTSPLEVKMHPTIVTSLNTGGTATLDFQISVKDGTNLTKQTTSEITFKIKGSNITSSKHTMNLIPTLDPTKLTISGLVTNRSNALTAGVRQEVNIKIKNNDNAIPLEDILVEIIPSTGNDSTLDWITLPDISDESEPYEIKIPSIDPKKDVTVKMYIQAPVTAKIDEEFAGVVKITSLSLKGEKISPIFSYKISKETKVDLIFSMKKEFKINCKESTGICEGETLATGDIFFENKGDVDLGPIKLEIDLQDPSTDLDCPGFLKINTTEIPNIPKKTKYTNISMLITNNPAETAPNIIKICVLKWTYHNPLDLSKPETGTHQITIEKSTRK